MISILFLLVSNAVVSRRDLSLLFNRIAIIILVYCVLQDFASLSILNKGIGLGYVPVIYSEAGNKIYIQIRKNAVPATVVKTPFYKA